MNSVPAIEAVDLEVGYWGNKVLTGVTFSVRKGEVFFIIGGSGCGKSTLLRHMVGLHVPTAGELRYFGRDFLTHDAAARREVLKSFGVLFQGGALWSSLSLVENVALPLELYAGMSRKEIRELATMKLAQVGLAGFEEHYPSQISGGMRKRAGLARALALDPPIVFFDEPSAGLDPVTSRKLDELVLHVRDTFGTTLVIVSHELDSIYSIADRVVMLHRDKRGIIADGNPRELALNTTDPRVSEFLGRPRSRT